MSDRAFVTCFVLMMVGLAALMSFIGWLAWLDHDAQIRRIEAGCVEAAE